MSTVDPAVSVAAVQEIKQVKARYFRAVDTKDWELYRSVFTDEIDVVRK